MKKFYQNMLSVVETRALIQEGYKYSVNCDYVDAGTTDPWSGMPNLSNNVAVFKDEMDAVAFAETQRWPFNPSLHSDVEELKWGETYAEMCERLDREKVERKAKKDAAEKAKADAMGLTVDEYKRMKNRNRNIKALEKEIAEMKKELDRKKAALARLMAEAAEAAH